MNEIDDDSVCNNPSYVILIFEQNDAFHLGSWG